MAYVLGTLLMQLFINFSAFAIHVASPSESMFIANAELLGNCAGDDIAVVEELGEHFLVAYFTDMDAVAKDLVEDKKHCLMKFVLNFFPGNQLNELQFFVDGQYQLADHGFARLMISHKVVNNGSVRTNKTFNWAEGNQSGDIGEILGSVKREELPPLYGRCGGSVPIVTSIQLDAVKPNVTESGLTKIELEKRAYRNYVKLGKFISSPCER